MKPIKTPANKAQRLYLQKSNNRWKWMVGATAAAAGVTGSQADTITINLLNNFVSAQGGNHLNADLTGDGHPDLTISGATYFHTTFIKFASLTVCYARAGVLLNGVVAHGLAYGDGGPIIERLGSKYYDARAGDPSVLTGSIPIFFKDLHINGGTPTKGSLEVSVMSNFAVFDSIHNPTVQLDSFTYNTPVPEGSSLALLAMGAGGILALRRSRAAQGRS